MEDCCVQVFDMKRIFDRRATEFICLTNANTTFDPATRHPHREAVRVVIASRAFGVLCCRLTTKFTAPDDECFVEQPTLFEVLK